MSRRGSLSEAQQREKVLEEFARVVPYAEACSAETTDGHFHRTRVAQVSELLRNCEGHRALDVGTGPGSGLRVLRQRGFRATGVDVSGPMLGFASRALSGVHLLRARADRLPFASARFDVVLCLGVLEYVWDLGAALEEVRRVLRPGGHLIASMLNPWSPHRVFALRVRPGMGRLLGRPGPTTTLVNTLGGRQLRRRLRKAGLPTVDTTYFDFTLFPPSVARRSGLALGIARRLEGRGRSALGPLATGVLVKCRRLPADGPGSTPGPDSEQGGGSAGAPGGE